MTVYDAIGETYQNTRRADERIVSRIISLLNLPAGSLIADIGAGTGNYSKALAKAGFRIYAVEPSSIMLYKAHSNRDVNWLQGAAEHIPLKNAGADGVFSTLAVHHFSDVKKAFEEIARIARTKSVVIFTFDCDAGRCTWMYRYFPFFWDVFDAFPSSQQLADMLGDAMGCAAKTEPFLLPHDINDGFAAAAWQQPQRYLNEGYRKNISSFFKADTGTVVQGVRKLSDDLATGDWEKQYGNVLQVPFYDAGYRFVYTEMH